MAHGIRQRRSFLVPNMCGKLSGKLGAAWVAGNAILPMLSDSVSPKIERTIFIVTSL